jgi:ABC-2 type transport system permease protein
VAEVGSLLRTYGRLVAAKVRSDWQYRVSFLTFLAAQSVVSLLDLAVILMIFDIVPSVGGWSVGEVAVLYGLTSFSFGLGDLFISQVETVAVHVREGTFDRFLMRPRAAVGQRVRAAPPGARPPGSGHPAHRPRRRRHRLDG